MRTSVVIAACNEGEALARTLESCFEAMGRLDFEVVVADDASADGSLQAAVQRFPTVRVVANPNRLGSSPTKALGAEHARGEVLVFLDGHTKPEPGAIGQLVDDVERRQGAAIVTPAIAALDATRWRNDFGQVGHGYAFDLEKFNCRWLELEELRRSDGTALYESPALIGCAFAISRDLYERVWGFDRHMRSWGAEDLDLGLKSWLFGAPVLHDPEAVIGHRFRASFDNYPVPVEDVLVNQLRLARKHFTGAVWEHWLAAARQRTQGHVDGHPEGTWARAWHLFENDRASVEQERSYLLAHRQQDEFWYAHHFGLTWPRLAVAHAPDTAVATLATPSKSPASPAPPVASYGVDTDVAITTANATALAGATLPGDPSKHVTFVGRYLSKGTASLSTAEVTRIHAAGLKVFSIQQHCNNAAAFFTGAIGTSHAKEAIQRAHALGQPAGTPIYFAVDYDPYTNWPATKAPCAAPAAGPSAANV